VGYAGDEVSDVVRAEKRRHGAAEGICSCLVGGEAGLGAGEGVGAGLVTSGDAEVDCGYGFGHRGRHWVWHRVWLAGGLGKVREIGCGWWRSYFWSGLRNGDCRHSRGSLSGSSRGCDGRGRGSDDRGTLAVRLALTLTLTGELYELQESGEYFGSFGCGSLHAGFLD
jgi:hypothetical protein